MFFAVRKLGIVFILGIASLTCRVVHADPFGESPHWFIDWGGKTQSVLNSTTGLPGIRAGMISSPFAFGFAAYALPNAITEGSPSVYQKQISYTLGGLYGEYRYEVAHWLAILPNLFVGYGAGDYETRDIDVIGQTIAGGFLIEPALNARFAFMHKRFINIGGGYAFTGGSSGVENGATFNIAFRIEW